MSDPVARRVRDGKTFEERLSERRIAFTEAAFDIIGEEGSTAVTVRALCKRTGLTARYFYECFDGRDEMIVSLFADTANETYERLVRLLGDARTHSSDDLARIVSEAFTDSMIDDPRKARLLLVEPLSERALSGISIAQVPLFARTLRDQLPRTPGASRALTTIAVAGAFGAIYSSWLSGSVHATRDEIVAACVEILQAAFANASARADRVSASHDPHDEVDRRGEDDGSKRI